MPASLTLGGVDLNRFVPNDVSFDMASGFQPVVSINAITVSSQPLSTSATQPDWSEEPLPLLASSQAELFTIDSSTPFLWLPEKICDAFALALNLTYNETLQLYLYGNGTDPSALADWNMTFTFTLADLPGSSKIVEIKMPYDAFNQQLTFPFPALNATFSSPAVDYFPLRRASNNTQYTIGRVFLQEAYLAVDYERNNFSISQSRFANDAVTKVRLTSITRPENSIFAGPANASTSSLSTGVKIGTGIGIAVLIIAIIGLGVFIYLRKKRKSQNSGDQAVTDKKGFFKRKSHGDTKAPVAEVTELLADKRHPQEVAADNTNTRFELPGGAAVEMPAEVPASYYTLNKNRPGSTLAELENRDSIPPHLNRSSHSSSLPAYSPTHVGRKSGSNISPSNTLLSGGDAGTGTLSSGISGISPDDASPSNPPRNFSHRYGSDFSNAQAGRPSEPSPLLPPTAANNAGSRSNLSLPRSREEDHTMPSRSISRSSRFREEGISSELQPMPLRPTHPPQPERRYSWEDAR